MQDFHHNRARTLLENAEELFSKEAVDSAVTAMADTLNTRFNRPGGEEFPLVLGVMGGAVVFTGNLLPQLTFPLEFDYIHVSRYGDDDRGGASGVESGAALKRHRPHGHRAGRYPRRRRNAGPRQTTPAGHGRAEVILAVFADKAIGKPKPVKADIVGITIPNRFVVGFGMDAYGYWRNLPGLWAIQTES
jgi:hypoxanthine phosphoribosyltransferase